MSDETRECPILFKKCVQFICWANSYASSFDMPTVYNRPNQHLMRHSYYCDTLHTHVQYKGSFLP